jgi:hypothetical protein
MTATRLREQVRHVDPQMTGDSLQRPDGQIEGARLYLLEVSLDEAEPRCELSLGQGVLRA